MFEDFHSTLALVLQKNYLALKLFLFCSTLARLICPFILQIFHSSKNSSLKLKDFFLENMVENRVEYVAIDCEMVATVEDINALARVSVVNENCNVLLDEFVVPESRIRDYRTRYSGITPQILKERGKGWPDLSIFE